MQSEIVPSIAKSIYFLRIASKSFAGNILDEIACSSLKATQEPDNHELGYFESRLFGFTSAMTFVGTISGTVW
jgi:hypothetical protein